MQKQSLQTCSCGQVLDLPEGEIKKVCSCGSIWEINNGGFWFTNLTIPFATIMAKPKPSHYEKYMANRNKRKAGRRC